VRELDAADRAHAGGHQPTREARQKTLARRHERPPHSPAWGQALPASGATPLGLTAPESRAMPHGPTGAVGSHGPIAGASPPQLLGAPEGTPAVTDEAQLRPRAMRAKETLGVARMRGVAARGDSHGPESNAWAEAGLDA
jgi:hypothetical protein